MELFDSEITEVCKLIEDLPSKKLCIKSNSLENTKNNMVFSNESAYELGGGFHESLSYELASSSLLDNTDELILIGKDLNELTSDTTFARITLLKVKEEKLEGSAMYERLEKIKLTKYRVSPNGYMLRTATGNKEKVRISKEFKDKYTFSDVGSSYIHAYKMLPFVISVKEIFITGDYPCFKRLKEIGTEKKEITDTLDHMLKGLVLNDCGSCSVKELCDKVEGLREIHKKFMTQEHAHYHSPESKKRQINRISRIIGHLEKVKNMIEHDEDCSDVLIQLSACKGAIISLGKDIMNEHMDHCIVHALEDGNTKALDSFKEAMKKFSL